MADETVHKVDSDHSPRGEMGQKYLAMGKHMAMRLWEQDPGDADEMHTRPYETVGYVVEGRVEIRVGKDTITCERGDSYMVPAGAERSYRIHKRPVAVEATSPAAVVHGRDDE